MVKSYFPPMRLLRQWRSQHLLLLTLLGILGGVAGAIKPMALAQNRPSPIRLINVVKYYEGLPAQNRAIELLQNQIDKMNPELLQADSIVANVWRDSDTLTGHVDIIDELDSLTGADPLDLAIASANLRTGAPVDIEVLTGSNVESPDQVMVTVTQGGVLDDSVAGIRYRFDIERQDDSTWEIQKAGQQFRCQLGRGHQDWSDQLCL